MKAISATLWANVVGPWEIAAVRAMLTVKAQLKKLLSGTIFAPGQGHYCDILVKVSGLLLFCPKNLPEAKLKRNRLIYLAEEISRISYVVIIINVYVGLKSKPASNAEREQIYTVWRKRKYYEAQMLQSRQACCRREQQAVFPAPSRLTPEITTWILY